MILDFKQIPESVMENFKGGEKHLSAHMFTDGKNRIFKGTSFRAHNRLSQTPDRLRNDLHHRRQRQGHSGRGLRKRTGGPVPLLSQRQRTLAGKRFGQGTRIFRSGSRTIRRRQTDNKKGGRRFRPPFFTYHTDYMMRKVKMNSRPPISRW